MVRSPIACRIFAHAELELLKRDGKGDDRGLRLWLRPQLRVLDNPLARGCDATLPSYALTLRRAPAFVPGL